METHQIQYYDNNGAIMSYNLKEPFRKNKQEIVKEFITKCSITSSQIISITKIEE